MKISICIPQYNRSAFLLNGLESIRRQTYKDIEVVVADDCSTDDTATVVPKYLKASKLDFKYFRHPKNLGYDGNLRSALAAGTGDYLFVMGNDDALPTESTIADLVAALESHGKPAVALGNYYDGDDRKNPSTRCRATEDLGSGVDLALRMFRAFSCVTALVFERGAFHRANTDKYDGSIYVQMYLASRIIAEGGKLLTIAQPLAATGLQVGGVAANAFADRLHEFRWKIRPALGGLDQVGRVVCDALQPCVPADERDAVAMKVFRQLLTYSYPYWLYDYRKKGEFWASLNLAIGCFPPSLTRHVALSAKSTAILAAVYGSSTGAGLFMPMTLLEPLKEVVRWTSRRAA